VNKSAKLLIDVFEKLQQLQENHLELFVLVRATSAAVREKFPDLPYDKHVQAVSNSEEVKKLREQQQIARVSIEAAKKQLLGGSDSN
jgi:hypothetical protein